SKRGPQPRADGLEPHGRRDQGDLSVRDVGRDQEGGNQRAVPPEQRADPRRARPSREGSGDEEGNGFEDDEHGPVEGSHRLPAGAPEMTPQPSRPLTPKRPEPAKAGFWVLTSRFFILTSQFFVLTSEFFVLSSVADSATAQSLDQKVRAAAT